MIDRQQSADALWRVAPGEARSLRIGPGPRTLQVHGGALWLTTNGTTDLPGEDYWLEPGDALLLPSGAEIVVEGWPEASFQLLVPPQACSAAHSISAWLSERYAKWSAARQRQRQLPVFAH
jgi:hypothetical protein